MTRLTAFLLTSASAAALFTGCAADSGDEAMYIAKAVAPGDSCSFTSDENEALIGHGRYVVNAPAPYRIIPQLRSKIVVEDESKVIQRTVQIRGARVNLSFADPSFESGIDESLLRFQSLFTAPLAPNGGITDTLFDLIPEGLSKAVAPKFSATVHEAEVIAKVEVYGDLSGSEVVSQEWQFPVTLCNDCIINDLGPCSGLSSTATVRAGNACNPFQDGVTDCCSEENGSLTCPAQGRATVN